MPLGPDRQRFAEQIFEARRHGRRRFGRAWRRRGTCCDGLGLRNGRFGFDARRGGFFFQRFLRHRRRHARKRRACRGDRGGHGRLFFVGRLFRGFFLRSGGSTFSSGGGAGSSVLGFQRSSVSGDGAAQGETGAGDGEAAGGTADSGAPAAALACSRVSPSLGGNRPTWRCSAPIRFAASASVVSARFNRLRVSISMMKRDKIAINAKKAAKCDPLKPAVF